MTVSRPARPPPFRRQARDFKGLSVENCERNFCRLFKALTMSNSGGRARPLAAVEGGERLRLDRPDRSMNSGFPQQMRLVF